jgi:hypothetical protein
MLQHNSYRILFDKRTIFLQSNRQLLTQPLILDTISTINNAKIRKSFNIHDPHRENGQVLG